MSFLSYRPCDTFLAMFGQLFLLSYFYLWNGSDCPIPVPPHCILEAPKFLRLLSFKNHEFHKLILGEDFCLKATCASSLTHI